MSKKIYRKKIVILFLFSWIVSMNNLVVAMPSRGCLDCASFTANIAKIFDTLYKFFAGSGGNSNNNNKNNNNNNGNTYINYEEEIIIQRVEQEHQETIINNNINIHIINRRESNNIIRQATMINGIIGGI